MMQRKLFLIWALIAAVILATTRAQDAEPEPEGEPAAEPEGKLGIISGGSERGTFHNVQDRLFCRTNGGLQFE